MPEADPIDRAARTLHEALGGKRVEAEWNEQDDLAHSLRPRESALSPLRDGP